MLKLATVLNNPGEPAAETRYRDPALLKRLGYNGLVIFESVGLSGMDSPQDAGSGEMRRWVEHQFEQVGEMVAAAKKQQLLAYLCCDALTLSRQTVERDFKNLCCKNRSDVVCPASDAAVERAVGALRAMLDRFGQADGVVLRLGDTHAPRLPYLVGNDVYLPHCPRCSSLSPAQRLARIIDRFHQLVVVERNQRLIVRAWNVRPGGMHDDVELARQVAPLLPGEPSDDRLVLSFKFTTTDFWRYQGWNASSLVWGQRPILYELQCQREFEGKGGVPNYQPPLWCKGSGTSRERNEPAGLAVVCKQIRFAGLWAWVRGGGWGGPFIKNETWIDANVNAVPRLAEQPDLTPQALAEQWIERHLGVEDASLAAVLRQVLLRSPEAARMGFYIDAYARNKRSEWHPNGDIIQDDVVDAHAAWRLIQRLPDGVLDDVVREKQEAVDIVAADRAALQARMTERNRKLVEPLVHSLIYTESLFETLRDLLAGLVAYRRYLRNRDADHAEAVSHRLMLAQSHWNHHTQRHGSLPGVATPFREQGFWDLTQKILSDLAEAAKAK